MKRLNTIPLLLGLLMLMVSCEKDDHECAETYSNLIVLQDLKITADTVNLSWSKLDTIVFSGYLIIRKTEKDAIVDPQDYNSNDIIQTIFDPNITSFKDKNVPFSSYLEYQIVGILSKGYGENYIFSNSKKYERPDIKVFDYNPCDIIPDIANNRFYFIEKEAGRISIFDYEKLAVQKSITTNAEIGYSSLGTYNNIKELYVPRKDGWVFVYNAETLEKIDQIDIKNPSSCVVNKNGKLFVSTDAWTRKPLKVVSRDTKAIISESGDHDDVRLRIIPNTNTEIIEVTINVGPTDIDYFKFDAGGMFLYHRSDRYHGDYPLNASVFQFFPDAEKFITSTEGAIYDIDMNYINRLPQGNLAFSDYAFNSTTSLIYCACSDSKSIVSYSYPDLVKKETIKTKAYPYKIFKKDNVLICISRISPTVASNYGFDYYTGGLIIEKIEIDN